MIIGRQQVALPLPQNKKKSSDDIFIELVEMSQIRLKTNAQTFSKENTKGA